MMLKLSPSHARHGLCFPFENGLVRFRVEKSEAFGQSRLREGNGILEITRSVADLIRAHKNFFGLRAGDAQRREEREQEVRGNSLSDSVEMSGEMRW
jgi:hypothetical protein